jgi:glycine betaine/proline transport system permease protein
MIATLIFAMPPMVRASRCWRCRGVPSEIGDFGDMVGCTPRQMTLAVMVPSARPNA